MEGRSNQDETISICEFRGYWTEIKEMTEMGTTKAPRRKVDKKEHLRTHGGLKWGIGVRYICMAQ